MRLLRFGAILVLPLAMARVEAQASRGLTIETTQGAVRVTAVRASSPGARAALRAGDLIERIVDERTGTAIATTPQEIMTRLTGDGPLSLIIQRGAQTVIARLEGEGGPSVPSFDRPTTVPSFDRPVGVPSTGGSATVPTTATTTTSPSARSPGALAPASQGSSQPSPTSPPSDVTSGPDRRWRRACGELRGPRLNRPYQWLSASGAATEQLWLNGDGSYALHRSSAVSSYAEDGCYQIEGKTITLYAVASSALAMSSGVTRAGTVTLGSSSTPFTRRTLPFQLLDGGRSGIVLDGERYQVTRDR